MAYLYDAEQSHSFDLHMAEYQCLFDGAEEQPGLAMSDWVKDGSGIMMWRWEKNWVLEILWMILQPLESRLRCKRGGVGGCTCDVCLAETRQWNLSIFVIMASEIKLWEGDFSEFFNFLN